MTIDISSELQKNQKETQKFLQVNQHKTEHVKTELLKI